MCGTPHVIAFYLVEQMPPALRLMAQSCSEHYCSTDYLWNNIALWQ